MPYIVTSIIGGHHVHDGTYISSLLEMAAMAKVENVGQFPMPSVGLPKGLLKITTITRGHYSRISQLPINATILSIIETHLYSPQ